MIAPVLASFGGRRQANASSDITAASTDATDDVILCLTDVTDDVMM
jgi:hypothetical protein